MALIIAGERSGVGKTTVTLMLLSCLSRRGLQVQSFKVGPDYIDPMFHKHVTGHACRNLDPVLTSENYLKECFYHYSNLCEYSLIEGVMGLFDGVNGNYASTAHVAKLLNLPVLLVVDCSRLSGSVAAIVHGYCSFDQQVNIAGVILNRVGSDRHLSLLKNSLAPLQIPLFGVIKRQDNITIRDRHLGLVPTTELPELNELIDQLVNLGESCFDWESLLPLLRKTEKANQEFSSSVIIPPISASSTYPSSPIKIAIAYDKAFNFYYQDNLDLLQSLGAELVFWSPLEDTELPKDIKGMYFGGGFPEVFAEKLAENTRTRNAVKAAILSGIPTIAECGGLMYCAEQIVDMTGKSWEMVGVLSTTAVMDKHLTLGYRRAIALQDSLLIDAGTTIYGHEFHRSRLISDSNNPLFETYRYDCDEFMGKEGWVSPLNLHASYIHMHWGNSLEIPQRFLSQCRIFNTLIF
ncbi:cobyrinate a,c-diamide synthase [Plectonema cf. radiosum LEGE 06105]|uniref:Cobyrinate a,c-diamide synthase n=1 Tax=Plectonema cf. radiosum LEGE 06105 TaxID=945769 RepID=A0A8J7FC82_9CYAN|nr:cobyrinate a,c-diamide synthase [Plectonema radiosum]MBE9213578.1 cobyrinate a,c-diamide synthase [Plectonema cf. radiosum LEGE 06105]